MISFLPCHCYSQETPAPSQNHQPSQKLNELLSNRLLKYDRLRYLTLINLLAADTIVQPGHDVCPRHGWVPHGDLCYYFSHVQKNWYDAKVSISIFKQKIIHFSKTIILMNNYRNQLPSVCPHSSDPYIRHCKSNKRPIGLNALICITLLK